jgi:tetratricopeptide (TPR) repeat protein
MLPSQINCRLAAKITEEMPLASGTRLRLFRFALLCLLGGAASTLAASTRATPTPVATPWDGLPAEAMQQLQDSQDAYNNLDFDRSKALAEAVIAQYPDHPLPRIFLQGTEVTEIQEVLAAHGEKHALFDAFDKLSDETVALAQKRDQLTPTACSQFYIGGSLGARGLVQLYEHNYRAAYRDGRDADVALRQALVRDPQLQEAWLGLGQYEYYTGRMAGLLRFILSLHGDVNKGISELETCSAHPSFTTIASRLCLARIYCLEVVNYPKALPYVQDVYARYPNTYWTVQMALADAKGLGLANPDAQALLESVFKQWDGGWRPPVYVKMDPEPLRLELATFYKQQGQKEKAFEHFKALASSSQPRIAELAGKELADFKGD